MIRYNVMNGAYTRIKVGFDPIKMVTLFVTLIARWKQNLLSSEYEI